MTIGHFLTWSTLRVWRDAINTVFHKFVALLNLAKFTSRSLNSSRIYEILYLVTTYGEVRHLVIEDNMSSQNTDVIKFSL